MITTDQAQTVLIVDDTPENIDVLSGVLREHYKLKVALNGERALKIAFGKSKPDLILLDVMMPGMDGYEVCRRLKEDPSTSSIPIIFVTAKNQEQDEKLGLDLGAADYITKPISAPIVLARVRTQLEQKRQREELQEAYCLIEHQKQRMEEELNVGREIQMGMLPQTFPAFPDHDEFSIYALLEPALEVGGDFYDYFFIDEDRLCFCVGDVSGKGVPAALFMAITKTLIKSRSSDDLSPASIITHVNKELSMDNSASMFVTVFMGIVNILTGDVVYTNAGHNPPYLLRSNGSIEKIEDKHGPVVGAMEGMTYKESKNTLGAGDVFFVYTDGVTEAMDPNKNFYSEKKLCKKIASMPPLNGKEIAIAVHDDVKSFEGSAAPTDDLTILAFQFFGTPEIGNVDILETIAENQLSEIERVNDEFNKFAEKKGISSDVYRRINMVFDDLLNNIISYAYEDNACHKICIRSELSSTRLFIIISDDGKPFNPFVYTAPDTEASIEERDIGGLGIYLVKNIMDKVSYQRNVNKNVITLIKDLD